MSQQSDEVRRTHERWKDIPGYEGLYQVSDLGRVRSLSRLVFYGRHNQIARKGTVLKLTPDKGYTRVKLSKEGKAVCWYGHRLVLLAFIGPRPARQQTRHLNGKRHDNRLKNLCYGTSKENHADMIRHGTSSRGERSYSHKLTWNQVKEIRCLYATGLYLQKQLAVRFLVRPTTIRSIITHKTWKE